MRRGQQYLEEREEQSPPSRQNPTHHGYINYTPTGMGPEESPGNPYGSDIIPMRTSSQLITPMSKSEYRLPQSSRQGPQPKRSAVLPSPSLLNFPNPQTLLSISPTTSSIQTSAHSAHLQDLQHQISLKTLALQTLQHEYDSLLQKLEWQRTKYASLERKSGISDVEINSLNDEKERLHTHVGVMESQVKDLQRSRDESRSQLAAQGAQYMRIMEMASRLQAKGAEDKKRWDEERTELEQRIKLLEEAMVTGTEQPAPDVAPQASFRPSSPSTTPSYNPAISDSSHAETINVLRAEVGRLRSRTHTLESALHTMRQESISIQATAQQLVELGDRLEAATKSVVGGGG